MKADIHPKYETVTATCSCGNQIVTRSTLCEDLHIDVCSQCHPFFTGKQKIVDSGGRVDRFKKRFGSRGAFFLLLGEGRLIELVLSLRDRAEEDAPAEEPESA